VLTHTEPNWQVQLESAAVNLTQQVDSLFSLSGVDSLSEGEISNRVVHMTVGVPDASPSSTEFYRLCGMRLCSQYVMDLLLERIFQRNADEVLTKINRFHSVPAFASVTGQLLERLILNHFSTLGQHQSAMFVVRRLDDGASSSAIPDFKSLDIDMLQLYSTEDLRKGLIPTSVSVFKLFVQVPEVYEFVDIENLKGDVKALQKPRVSNFCGIDFILPGFLPVNVTLSPAYGLKLSGRGLMDASRGFLEVREKLERLLANPADASKVHKVTSLSNPLRGSSYGFCVMT
jgi:hypothetical protein